MAKVIHVHLGKKTKDAEDVRVTHVKEGVAAAMRTIKDGEAALSKGDLHLAGRYFVSASITLENIGKQAQLSAD